MIIITYVFLFAFLLLCNLLPTLKPSATTSPLHVLATCIYIDKPISRPGECSLLHLLSLIHMRSCRGRLIIQGALHTLLRVKLAFLVTPTFILRKHSLKVSICVELKRLE